MNIRYKTTTTKCNSLFFFNMQLNSGRGRGFTCMTFGKSPHYIENVPEWMPFPLYRLDFVLSWNFISRPIFTFLWPDSILLHKRKITMETRLFILFWIISFWSENVSLHLLIFLLLIWRVPLISSFLVWK